MKLVGKRGRCILDLTGMRFGMLTAIRPTEDRKSNSVMWECKCDCGSVRTYRSTNLRRGSSKSCGCVRKELARTQGYKNKTHGIARSPQWRLLHGAKERAKRKGLEFNLELEDVVIPEFCPVLGIPLTTGYKTHHSGSPSVDRIDNSRGYTKDNICVISRRANSLKNDASVEELEAVISYMKNERYTVEENKEKKVIYDTRITETEYA